MLKGKILWVMSALLVAAGIWWWQSLPNMAEKDMPIVNVEIGNGTFALYAPKTDIQLQRGLAAFDRLEENQGMIFRGLPVGVQTFWMKNMKFNIDIIWVNKDNQIIHIIYDVSKDSYPTKFSNPANRPSTYVIELMSGSAEKHDIAPGTIVKFQP